MNTQLHLGACIVGGKLYATVMDRDARGYITVVATAEMDAEKLRDQDYLAAMRPVAPLIAALKLAEDVLSHRPWSAEIWPDGTHPMAGITTIRQAIADATGEPCGHCTPASR